MNRIFATSLVVAALTIPALSVPGIASAQGLLNVEVAYGPPALPWYSQPPCPGSGYIWTPGYWGYGPWGYYWVPGTWVLAPAVGLVWTPGYWAWNEGLYWWHTGYWASVVGFYGGVDYGYGYPGSGYFGGYWRHRAFYYNRAVTNINVTYIHNTYNQTVVNVTPRVVRVSYNGGPGGLRVRPSVAQRDYAREHHRGPVDVQMRQERWARNQPAQRFEFNQGRPHIAATQRAGELAGTGNARPQPPSADAHRTGRVVVTREPANVPRYYAQAAANQRQLVNQLPTVRDAPDHGHDGYIEYSTAHAEAPARRAPVARPVVRTAAPAVRPPRPVLRWQQLQRPRDVEMHPQPMRSQAPQVERRPVARPETFRRAPGVRSVPRIAVPSRAHAPSAHGSGHPRIRPR